MDKQTQRTMFSSATDNWATPQHFFDALERMYGKFDLDPCASADNAKCQRYFTKDDNGLAQHWSGNVFCNPPYGRVIGDWVEKSYRMATGSTTVVMLIPARTDTKYWHDYVMNAKQILFVKGRLRFGDGRGSAPFPSAVVVFGDHEGTPSVGTISSKT